MVEPVRASHSIFHPIYDEPQHRQQQQTVQKESQEVAF